MRQSVEINPFFWFIGNKEMIPKTIALPLITKFSDQTIIDMRLKKLLYQRPTYLNHPFHW